MGDLKRLAQLGVSPTEVIALRNEYPDVLLQDFVEKYILIISRYKEQEELRLGDIIVAARQTGTKKGNTLYGRWRRSKLNRIDELSNEIEAESLTVFERLRRLKTNKTSTVFDRIKRVSDGV